MPQYIEFQQCPPMLHVGMFSVTVRNESLLRGLVSQISAVVLKMLLLIICPRDLQAVGDF